MTEPPPPPLPTDLVVSDPLSHPSAAKARPSSAPASAAATDTVYVSLPPGTAPNGQLATIQNLRTGSVVEVPVGAGGFDPVPVSADAGDTIEVVVRDPDGTIVHSVQAAVGARRPPVVVRTNPGLKRDVPLNASIVIVFSEPIEPTTVNAETIQLLLGSRPVDGRREFRDSTHTTVVFTPAALLAPATTYEIVVTQGIRDLEGESLEAPVTVSFTTASAAGGYEEYFVDSDLPLTARNVGDSVSVDLTVRVLDGTGAGIEQAVVRFRPSIGRVDPDTTRAGLDGLLSVHWMLHGTLGGGAGTAELSACASNSPTRCDQYWQVLVIGLNSL